MASEAEYADVVLGDSELLYGKRCRRGSSVEGVESKYETRVVTGPLELVGTTVFLPQGLPMGGCIGVGRRRGRSVASNNHQSATSYLQVNQVSFKQVAWNIVYSLDQRPNSTPASTHNIQG